MDYMLDLDFENDNNGRVVFPEFIYDDRRKWSIIYTNLKLLGLIFYTATLHTCSKPDFYIIMIVVMFLSTMNNIRYEYSHYKRYGTIFSSLDDFYTWKKELYPKSRIVFSTIELSIKIGFFIKIFPPEFEFSNLCEIGESIYKLHILGLFVLYFIACAFSICVLTSIYCYEYSHPNHNYNRRRRTVLLPIPIILNNSQIIINNQTEECCICMDIDNTQTWVILPCGHKFHEPCISSWLNNHQTCPVCRLNIISVV